MAAWLAEQGYSVHVVAAPPYYPEWRVADTHVGRGYQRERIDGVHVWRAPLWVPARPNGLKRVLHLLSFAASSLPVMLTQVFWKPDVVLVVAPAFVCTPAALITARLSGAKSWLHVQDFEVDVAFKQGLLKGQLLHKLSVAVERWLFKQFDVVSSISQRMMARVRDKGVHEPKLIFFPNWVDIDKIRPTASGSAGLRDQLGIAADSVVALFSGSLGRKQGLMLLPATAQLLVGLPNLVFVICGDGVLKQELEEACAGLPNVKMLPLQPLDRLGDLLGMADLHLLPQSADASDLVMPSKLSGMLASGRAVIATTAPDTEIASVLESCGVVVPPEDAPALASAIQALASDRPHREHLGRQGRRFAEAHLAKTSVLDALQSNLLRLIL